MEEKSLLIFYLKMVILPFILAAGLFGNLIGIMVFLKKHRRNLPSYKIYITLSIVDSFSLVFQIGKDLLFHLGIDLFKFTYFLCKFLNYIHYCVPSVSGWLLVSISIDRFISIQFSKFYITKKYWLQKLIILGAFVCNLIAFTPVLIFAELRANYSNNISLNDYGFSECDFFEKDSLINNLDLINSTLLPFLFMLTFSGLLIFIIFKSRLKVLNLSNQHDRNRLKKDIKFAVSSIFFNLFFFILNIFNCVYSSNKLSVEYDISLWVYYISFCVNFYILFAFNSIFRRQIFILFNLRSKYSVHTSNISQR